MQANRCDFPPRSHAPVVNHQAREHTVSSAVSPVRSGVFPGEWCVRNAAHQRQRLIGDLGGCEAERSFSSATILGACPSPDKLDTSVRCHFGIRPVSYAALSHAVQDVVARLTDYGTMLMARDRAGGRAAVDVTQSADLLAAMRALDVQYGIWERIITESREPILRMRRATLGRAGANPFIAMRRDLHMIRERVMGLACK